MMSAKYYVRCGELEKIVTAATPREACDKAVDLCKDGEVLDPHWFYVDERGFRGVVYKGGVLGGITQCCSTDEKARWSISTNKILKGWAYEEIEEEE